MHCHNGNEEHNNEENKNEKGTHNNSPIKHIIHMILHCSIPLIIILSLPFIARYSPKSAIVLGFIAPFICPLMMGGMIFAMFRGKRKKQSNDLAIEESEKL